MTPSMGPYGRILPDDEDGKRFLRVLEHPWYHAVACLQDIFTVITTQFWSTRGVRNLHLPVTTSAVSSPMGRGSDSTPIQIQLDGIATHLADSMQFALEYGCRLSERGCWYIMPSFRGEPADETHLCQFLHSEVELPILLHACMETAEAYVKALCEGILASAQEVIERLAGGTAHVTALLDKQFQRVSFEEAWGLLRVDPRWTHDSSDGWRTLTRAGERELIRRAAGAIWLTNWDHLAVPFYQAFDRGDETRALNADLLLGAGELLGLGQRHLGGGDVDRALALHRVDSAPYRWYTEMHADAPLQTSGFGMGVERFLAWITQHDDVRDFQLLPRHNGLELIP